MLCPFCNDKMIKGKILGDRYMLKWMPDDEKLILGIWANNSLKLGKRQSGLIGRPNVEAFVCRNCRKLIADL